MSIVEKFMTMEYGPAPEDRARGSCLAGPSRAGATGISLTERGRRPRRELIRHGGSFHGRKNSRRWRKDRRRTLIAP